MYKKITHNIVEEHFDHPAVLPKKMQMSMPKPQPGPKSKMYYSEEDYGTWAAQVWSTYLWYLQEVVHSAMLTTLTEQTTADFMTASNAVTDLINDCIGQQEASTAAAALAELGKTVVKILEAAKTKKPLDMLIAQAQTQITAIAEYLYSLKPDQWPAGAVSEILNTLLALVIRQAGALAAGDWAEEIKIREQEKTLIDQFAKVYASGFVSDMY